MTFAADLHPLPTRCADGLGQCPEAAQCERTAPADATVLRVLFDAYRRTTGVCPYYLPRQP